MTQSIRKAQSAVQVLFTPGGFLKRLMQSSRPEKGLKKTKHQTGDIFAKIYGLIGKKS